MRIEIVIGLNFGDEGKGARVNYLCSNRQKPLIIRFSGGHHVGHTVELKDVNVKENYIYHVACRTDILCFCNRFKQTS